MSDLLVGFDSAWTRRRLGAMVGVLRQGNGTYRELGPPRTASFDEAAETIRRWREAFTPSRTLVFLDQPTIVPNPTGQRPVEHIVASLVSRRYGGVQPANTSRQEMFGPGAPLWSFLEEFDGTQDPFVSDRAMRVLETYPVLAMIAFGWILPDEKRATGRLPKYNPERRKTFLLADWTHVCRRSADALASHGLPTLSVWMDAARQVDAPRKALQDCVDASLCLLVTLHVAEGKESVLIGQETSGYMIVPSGSALWGELEARCLATERDPANWIRSFRL
jgi:predicted RNase H-like nuclease